MESNEQPESSTPAKDLFRIGEVSRLTSTKPFVLRYWETEFPMLQPVKSPKGHRLYRREDVDMVFVIKRLLYDEGFTIAGARRHLRDQSAGMATGSNGSNESNGSGVDSERVEGPDQLFPEDISPSSRQEYRPSSPQFSAPSGPVLDRKTLLDLRDSLRSLLTVLESE